eukprot:4808659-Prorocentrum_lima.AAC.1
MWCTTCWPNQGLTCGVVLGPLGSGWIPAGGSNLPGMWGCPRHALSPYVGVLSRSSRSAATHRMPLIKVVART